MKMLGIRFAPLNVSLDRRLQTLAVAIWICAIHNGILVLTITILYLLLYTQIRYFVLLYFLWMFYDWDTCNHNDQSPSKWSVFLRNNVYWRYFCNYFPAKLVKTVDLDPTKSYLFVCIPHGLVTAGIMATFGTDVLNCRKLFPGLDIRVIVHYLIFTLPFVRECAILAGCCSSNAESIKYLLSTPPQSPFTGRASLLMVGGNIESYESKPGIYRTIVKKKKGFIKLALQHGTTLVPVFSFGETDLFNQWDYPEGSLLRRLQHYISRDLRILPLIFWGRGYFQNSFGYIPYRTPINVVVGGPLELPKIAEPTAEQINKHHEKFIQQLVELFETHKHSYVKNPEKTVLELV